MSLFCILFKMKELMLNFDFSTASLMEQGKCGTFETKGPKRCQRCLKRCKDEFAALRLKELATWISWNFSFDLPLSVSDSFY